MYRQVLLIFFISYFGWDIAFVVYNLVDSHPEKFGDFINRFYRKLPFSFFRFIVIGGMQTCNRRYSPQIFIEEVGVMGQRKIAAAKVLVFGAGGLGSPVIQYLAAAGVGIIGVVDFDKVEIHNLNRQTIHNKKNIGKLKVESAMETITAFNSSIQIIPINEKNNERQCGKNNSRV